MTNQVGLGQGVARWATTPAARYPIQEDVAAPVAEGYSNGEIAQRLLLPPEPVSSEIADLF